MSKNKKLSIFGIDLDLKDYKKRYLEENVPFIRNHYEKLKVPYDYKVATEDKGKNWDTRKLYPQTPAEFKEKFFKKKKPKDFEGIWQLPGMLKAGLVKEGNYYQSYIITFNKRFKVSQFSFGKFFSSLFTDHGTLDFSIMNGTKNARYYETKNHKTLKYSGIMTNISWKDSSEKLPINFLVDYNVEVVGPRILRGSIPGMEQYESHQPITLYKVWPETKEINIKDIPGYRNYKGENENSIHQEIWVQCSDKKCKDYSNHFQIREKSLEFRVCPECRSNLKRVTEKVNPDSKNSGIIDPKKDKEKNPGVGSGFFISDSGLIITNSHVVEGSDDIKVQYEGDEIKAKVLATDKGLDLALIKTNLKNKNFVKFSNKSPYKSQEILVAGFPFGKAISDDLKITGGIINSLKGAGNDTTRMQIDATINPGNSGGPIVDKLSKSLIGVAVAQLSKDFTKAAFGVASENTNYAIKASQVKDFLESNNIEIKISDSKDKISNVENSTVFIIRY